MHSHASPLSKSELPVERRGLQTAYGLATREELGKRLDDIPMEVLECVHGGSHSDVGLPEKTLLIGLDELEVLRNSVPVFICVGVAS